MADSHAGTSPVDVDALIVRLGEHRLALPLEYVERVLPAVATVPLPRVEALVVGVMNLHGRPLAVLDVRPRLGLPVRAVRADDHFVACRLSGRDVALWVDAVESVTQATVHPLADAGELRASDALDGVMVAADGLAVVYDLDAFLADDEVLRIDHVVAAAQGVR